VDRLGLLGTEQDHYVCIQAAITRVTNRIQELDEKCTLSPDEESELAVSNAALVELCKLRKITYDNIQRVIERIRVRYV
jgi:hypothetical protein